MPRQKGYNAVAWCYDALKLLVFGRAPDRAERHFLHLIPPGSRVLIVGGGSGAVLEALAVLHPQPLRITFIDAAPAMIAKARLRQRGSHQVIFETMDILASEVAGQYDCIITSFLLDNFTDPELQVLFHTLQRSLVPGGYWFDTDFRATNRWRHHFLLGAMYWFFSLLCGISARKTPNVENFFHKCGFSLINRAFYANKFICTAVFVDKK
ncbi:MAG: class I SAM-dependent methyltransferase [Chitinophagia bacterium]|nr:class I SAM-dependent methyltransferase [Chitinophagia bacterium]